MPGTRIQIFPDNRPEGVIRRSLLRQWTIVIALMAWIGWFTTNHYNGKSILYPLAVSFIGIGLGWIFGYKLGFGPVFSSSYIFSAERVVEPKKWIPFDKLVDRLHKFRPCPECGGKIKQDIFGDWKMPVSASPECTQCKTIFKPRKRWFQDGFRLSQKSGN